MLDIKYIRENKEKVKEACRNKKIDFDVDYLFDLDSRRRELLQLIEEKNAMKNQANQRIKEAETEEQRNMLIGQMRELDRNSDNEENEYKK